MLVRRAGTAHGRGAARVGAREFEDLYRAVGPSNGAAFWATIDVVVSLRRQGVGVFVTASVALLVVGAGMWLGDWKAAADALWGTATLLGLGYAIGLVVAALRRREPSVDVIAVLALGGALAVREPFAGAMIAVMLGTGRLLEARADARARRDLSLLVERAPRTARRRVDNAVVELPVDQVCVGDRIVVASGEVVPVDGRLLTRSVLDESALTGESLPVDRGVGEDVRSGVVNAGEPLELLATTTAAESTYAGVVRLVEQAQASSAPFVRFADRVAVFFVPLTLALAGAAWAWSADPVRAVAVLVVATPCPLLLAVPIAIMSGLSRAARAGVIVKGGGALERLAGGRVMLFDKTGTLTRGRPQVTDIVAADNGVPAEEVIRLAASLDQLSPHVLAAGIVAAGARGRLPLLMPSGTHEIHGHGIEGDVGAHRVRLGKLAFIAGDEPPRWARQARRRAELDGSLAVFVGVDGEPAAALLLSDPIRPDARRMIRALRTAGIDRVVLVTGDRADIADTVGRLAGVDAVLADCDPAAKLAAIRQESATGATIMVGDGVNDAPALAAAGAGVALAARGATASSEAADVVLTVDRVDALADAILIAQRAKRIAWRAASVGMGSSIAAMAFAALGFLPPAAGAVLQELIDVLAIGIALIAVLPGRTHTVAMSATDIATAHELRAEHDSVLPVIEQIRAVADALSTAQPNLDPASRLLDRLENELLPHEDADETVLVPLVARALGGTNATAGLSRTHAEIAQQITRLRRLLDGLDTGHVHAEDIIELRRLLYGLHAILQLHYAQEEEEAFSLVPEQSTDSNSTSTDSD
jgi:heavy metal translocating P-type ATPase